MASPDPAPTDVDFETNLYSVDSGTNKMYQHSGFTTTISDSFTHTDTGIIGIAWDGKFFWTNNTETGLIFKQDPVTGDVLGSIPMPALNCRGMTWDGNYLWTVSLDNQTIYQIDVGELGVPEEYEHVFHIYPNPGKGIFHLRLNIPQNHPVIIQVTDLQGRILKEFSWKEHYPGSDLMEISLEDLPDGIYFLHLVGGNNTAYKKLIFAR